MSPKDYVQKLVGYVKNLRNDGFSRAMKADELRKRKDELDDSSLQNEIEEVLCSLNV